MKKIELLAPAGDLEKMKTAVSYGADAVYFGGENFSLRAGAGNLSLAEIEEGLEYAHSRGAKGYMTLNIYAHNEDIGPLESYLRSVKELGIDAFLISDPGIVDIAREICPDTDIHLSTQANMTNYRTALFWKRMGVSRIVLARELSLGEIAEIKSNIPEDIELEAFVHGAMCISYSGRCLLSSFMTGRDSNRGMCAHPCRYKYSLVEEKRPGEYWPVEEDDRGTYIMNSKDLCMIRHIPELADSGISSLKIEGRMKSIFYVATVVHAYRQALDAYLADPLAYRFDESWMDELLKASHREFTTGFFFGQTGPDDQNYETSKYIKDYSFVGKVTGYDEKTGLAAVEQRNKMVTGETVEVFGPDITFFEQKVRLFDGETGEPLESAPHPQQKLLMPMNSPVKPGYLIRKKV